MNAPFSTASAEGVAAGINRPRPARNLTWLGTAPLRRVWRAVRRGIIALPYFRFVRETATAQTPCTLGRWFTQKVLGFNRHAYWPMHFTSTVTGVRNIHVGIDASPGWEPGCYIQGIGKVYIGDYTQIARNVGIISANHDVYDSRRHVPQEVRIGAYCWIGMNAVILPGVVLGDWTIVGAGAVVTRSFPEGHCVIGGNPARMIRQLEPHRCVPFRNGVEYNGYIPAHRFSEFRRACLRV